MEKELTGAYYNDNAQCLIARFNYPNGDVSYSYYFDNGYRCRKDVIRTRDVLDPLIKWTGDRASFDLARKMKVEFHS